MGLNEFSLTGRGVYAAPPRVNQDALKYLQAFGDPDVEAT
jgi:hypothetical protein